MTRRFSPAQVIIAGLLVGAVGLGVVAQVDGGLTAVVLGSTILALGLGPVATLAADLVISSAPKERAGSAAGASETSSELGGALGIAGLGSLALPVFQGGLPAGTPDEASETVGGAVAVGQALGDPALVEAAREAFSQALAVSAATGGTILVLAGLVMLKAMRDERHEIAASTLAPATDGTVLGLIPVTGAAGNAGGELRLDLADGSEGARALVRRDTERPEDDEARAGSSISLIRSPGSRGSGRGPGQCARRALEPRPPASMPSSVAAGSTTRRSNRRSGR